MDVEAPRGLLRRFDEVEDPRVERTKLHRLPDILVITLCAVICGAASWTEIELFGKGKRLQACLKEEYLLRILRQGM